MGHFVTGVIATTATLEAFSSDRALHAPVSLSQGLALLPLRDVDLDAFLMPPLGEAPAGFLYLFAQLSEQLQEASKGSPMAYIETDYFGGIGSQAAIVFVDGHTVRW